MLDAVGQVGILDHVAEEDELGLELCARCTRRDPPIRGAAAHRPAPGEVVGAGLVAHVFQPEDLDKLPGPHAIGHTRYSTTGTSSDRNLEALTRENRVIPHLVKLMTKMQDAEDGKSGTSGKSGGSTESDRSTSV